MSEWYKLSLLAILFTLLLHGANAELASAAPRTAGQWMSGDFHQHTLYTDGNDDFDSVMSINDEYGLDWWANSEHGGAGSTDGNGHYWDSLDDHPSLRILGYKKYDSNGHRMMWSWQSLRDYVFADIQRSRGFFPGKLILSAFEWNVPGHEHASVGIVSRNASALSAFEYQFDHLDFDTSRNRQVTRFGILSKRNGWPISIGEFPPQRSGSSG